MSKSKDMTEKNETEKSEQSAKKVAPVGKKRVKMFKLIIHNQEGAEGKQAVPVGVNGKMWNIPRNTEVEVPESVIEVLKNANMSLYDDKGTESTAKRFVYEYSEIKE